MKFSKSCTAHIDFFMASGRTLDATVLITKLHIRALFEYLNKPDRPMKEDLNSLRLIIRGCNTVGKLQLARKELEELEIERPGEWPRTASERVAAALKEG